MDSDLAWVSDDIKVALESARQGLLDMEEDSRLVRCAVNAKSVADFWANMRNEEQLMTIHEIDQAISESGEMSQAGHDLWSGMCRGDQNEYIIRAQRGEDPDALAAEISLEAVEILDDDAD